MEYIHTTIDACWHCIEVEVIPSAAPDPSPGAQSEGCLRWNREDGHVNCNGVCTQSLYLSTDPNPFLKPSLELTAESHIDLENRRLRQQRGKSRHLAFVGVI